MSEGTKGTKAKIDALRVRLATVTKAADLLSISREIEALSGALAREEARGGAFVWPRDLNDGGAAEPPKDWGKDPADGAAGG